jgi:hypothetical protein
VGNNNKLELIIDFTDKGAKIIRKFYKEKSSVLRITHFQKTLESVLLKFLYIGVIYILIYFSYLLTHLLTYFLITYLL